MGRIFAVAYKFTERFRKQVPQNISPNKLRRMTESISLHIKDIYLNFIFSILGIMQVSLVSIFPGFLLRNIIAKKL